MKSNILIVGFLKNFNTDVCQILQKKLGMFFADVGEIVAYDIENPDEIISKCGIDYLNKLETRTMRSISNYENSLISINYDYFFFNDNHKLFKNTSHIIYVKVMPEKIKKIIEKNNNAESWASAIDVVNFDERNEKLEKNCDFIAYSEKLSGNAYANEIINYLKKEYSEVL